MKLSHSLWIGLVAGTLSLLASCGFNAKGEAQAPKAASGTTQTAIFAGGCFWCVESDFDKVPGVMDTVSGYIGGEGKNPTYQNHDANGFFEAVKVTYDPQKTNYATLVNYFFKHIDPTDDGGQFCDRGNSYRTAIFYSDLIQRETVLTQIKQIEAAQILAAPIVTRVLPTKTFWPAEAYHQNYYLKNSIKYKYYRTGCGRDARIAQVWSGKN